MKDEEVDEAVAKALGWSWIFDFEGPNYWGKDWKEMAPAGWSPSSDWDDAMQAAKEFGVDGLFADCQESDGPMGVCREILRLAKEIA